MSIKTEVINYLERQPMFRERSNKDRGIVNLLMNRYGVLNRMVESGEIKKETIVAIVQDYASMDRAWRHALERNEDLRGSDYGDKERLEQVAQIALGYGQGPKD